MNCLGIGSEFQSLTASAKKIEQKKTRVNKIGILSSAQSVHQKEIFGIKLSVYGFTCGALFCKVMNVASGCI
jgi:hypothetical protein